MLHQQTCIKNRKKINVRVDKVLQLKQGKVEVFKQGVCS